MYGVGGSEAIARDMDSLLFSSNFKLMHSDLYNYQQPPQQPLPSSNLARYRSAPSSFFASLLNDGVTGGGDDEEHTNRESEIMFPRFDSDESDAIDLKFPKALKQEMTEAVNDYSSVSAIAPSEMVYATPAPAADYNSVLGDVPYAENSFRGLNSSVGMESLNQVKSSGNCSNLIRQSSSPAGFLSNLADEIGNFCYFFLSS